MDDARTQDQTLRPERARPKTSQDVWATAIILREGAFCSTFRFEQELTTIGRSRACIIALENDFMASREHAQIRAQSEDGKRLYFLSDLASTNGTFLNGRQLNPHQAALLSDGDKISVGEHTLAFSMAEASSEKLLSGSLSQITIFDLIQILETNRLTATLLLRAPQISGRLFFNDGVIVDCLVDNLFGEAAFKSVIALNEGFFEVERSEKRFPKRIYSHSNTNLVLETLRMLDEENERSDRRSDSSAK